MQRVFLAVGLLAVACLSVRADEDKKEEKAPAFKEVQAEFIKKYRAADDEGKAKAMKEYAPKFLTMAEKGGKSPEAFQAILFSLQISSISKDAAGTAKATALLKKNHLDNAQLEKALPTVARALGDDAGPFFKELMEKGATDRIKAAACLSLIEARERALAEAKGDEAEKIKKEMAELRKTGVEKFKMKDLFVGGKLPDLKSENLDGKEEKLSQYKGKVVVLDIWATWCPPCRAMIPHERKLVERLKDKPFVLISVSFDDEKETVTKFLEKEKMPWVHWFNGRKGEIGEQLNVKFFPTIFVLDAKGVIRFKGVRGEAMDKAVDKLIKELEEEKKSS